MHRFFRGLSVLLFPLLFIHCGEGVPDEEQTRAEIRATWDEFIRNWEAEEAEACAKIFARNGLSIPPKSNTLEGRGAIASFYLRLFEENLSSRYEHEIISIHPSDNQVVERGAFTVYWIANDSTAWSYAGRSLTHWKRQSDGDWNIVQFMFNNPEDPRE